MRQTEQVERFVAIPETYSRRQLNALYRDIPLKDATFRTLRKYFNAAANLYGIITLEKLYEIISGQSPSLVTREEFLAFAEIARHECEDYYILGEDDIYTDGAPGDPLAREIIDITLFGETIDRYLDMKRDHQGKPWFIPAKKQLLLYDDPFYCEETPEALALRLFLAERFKLDEPKDTAVFCEILYGTRCLGVGFTEVTNRLHEMGLEFESEADLRRFAALHQSFHNATRMQCNRGYTPDELFEMQPPEERMPRSISLGSNIRKAISDGTMDVGDLRRSILTMKMPSEELRASLLKEIADAAPAAGQMPKAKKVGRNEPCPCGSGKKYKKCCGR